jgi:hypothetical protein
VRYPRNNLLRDVLLDIFPRFAVFGNFGGQQLAQVSGSNVGHHAVIRDVLIVIDDLERDAMLVSAGLRGKRCNHGFPYLDQWRHGPLRGTGWRPFDLIQTEVVERLVLRATSRKDSVEVLVASTWRYIQAFRQAFSSGYIQDMRPSDVRGKPGMDYKVAGFFLFRASSLGLIRNSTCAPGRQFSLAWPKSCHLILDLACVVRIGYFEPVRWSTGSVSCATISAWRKSTRARLGGGPAGGEVFSIIRRKFGGQG